jgi:hypothetical protein
MRCAQCDIDFLGSAQARYCGLRCQTNAYRARKREREKLIRPDLSHTKRAAGRGEGQGTYAHYRPPGEAQALILKLRETESHSHLPPELTFGETGPTSAEAVEQMYGNAGAEFGRPARFGAVVPPPADGPAVPVSGPPVASAAPPDTAPIPPAAPMGAPEKRG